MAEIIDICETEPALPRQSPRRSHPRALSDEQKREILEECSTERFIDRSPAQIVAALLDEQQYLASERTLYRLIGANAPLLDRRRQRRHPAYAAPELVATAPHQVWSWDITKLKGPVRGASYQLYVILDIYSRYVVGWALHERESDVLARQLIETICRRQKIGPGQLTVHADRGPAMRSHEVAALLDRLGVDKSHSRPYCSNDNAYSGSQFKTMKYAPEYPARFGSIKDARAFCRHFFKRYNREHRHTGWRCGPRHKCIMAKPRRSSPDVTRRSPRRTRRTQSALSRACRELDAYRKPCGSTSLRKPRSSAAALTSHCRW